MGKVFLGFISLFLFAMLMFSVAQADSVTTSIHQRASACFNDFDTTFEDDPAVCDSVCRTCHAAIDKVGEQSANPEGKMADEAYLGLVPAETDSYDDEWAALPERHQACRECHTGHSEEEGTHPIFVEILLEEENDQLKTYDGKLLCTTCHNPHSDHIALLRMKNSNSKLCQACHKK